MINELLEVTVDDKEISRNLIEKYNYEFSQKGNYRLIGAYPGTKYDDVTLGDIFFFEN